MSLLAATAVVTALVGLPAGATAPPPGSLPPQAQVRVLDRQLGFISVTLPRRGAAQAIARLRGATGVRYVIRPSLAGGLAATACPVTVDNANTSSATWRSTIDLGSHSAAGFTVGIADSGADLGRLGGSRDRLAFTSFNGSSPGVEDDIGHGTQVASLIGGNRTDLSPNVRGVAPDVGLAIARIESADRCNATAVQQGLVMAFRWFRQLGDVQVVNVSANVVPNPMLVEALQKLQQSGTLVVAATGNEQNPHKATFPAIEPHVIGVGALIANSKKAIYGSSGRGTDVDLVAPGGGAGVIVSGSTPFGADVQTGVTDAATSYATPIVSGAAALVWAAHPDWDASRVSAALTASAVPLKKGQGRPNRVSGWGRLDVKAALAANPPADLDEPNEWASAVEALTPLSLDRTHDATVGGQNDPFDAYPLDTLGSGSVQVSGSTDLRAYLLPLEAVSSRRIDVLSRQLIVVSARSVAHGEGSSVRLHVPRKGAWVLVVNARSTTRPVQYTVRAS